MTTQPPEAEQPPPVQPIRAPKFGTWPDGPERVREREEPQAAPADTQALPVPYVQAETATQAQETRNGLAVAGMILGITSLVFCWWGLASLAQVVLAIVFGAVGLKRANRGAPNKGMAVAALVCGILGGLAYLIFGIATLGVGFII